MKQQYVPVVLAIGASLAFAQPGPVPATYGHYRRLPSKILSETRTLLIHLPDGYDKSGQSFPVVYQLDGDQQTTLRTVSALAYLSGMAGEIPGCIVVGIENANRNRDMGLDQQPGRFLQFIKDELVPFIDANYRTTRFRVLAGMSAGSVFAVYSFLKQPELFDAFLLGSFGLGRPEVVAQFEQDLKQIAPRTAATGKYFFASNGKRDRLDPDGARGRNGARFLDSLRQALPSSQVMLKEYGDEGHVPFPTVYDGLRWIYAQQRYLGQTPPGRAAEVFARGIVSTGHLEHSTPAFSPDGNEVFWSLFRRPDKGEPEVIMTSRCEHGVWSAPAVAPFSGQFSDGGPAFSADGRRLYFSSARPTPTGGKGDIWFVDRTDRGWSEPRCLGLLARFPDLHAALQLSLARNGTMYFMGHAPGPLNNFGIYRTELVNGQYVRPELLPASINQAPHLNWTPFTAPDESHLLFSSNRRSPATDAGDLYITRRRRDGTWTDPVALGEAINTGRQERFPRLSPCGEYLFFTRPTPGFEQDVYWISASVLAPRPD